jgi:hypothetical protein
MCHVPSWIKKGKDILFLTDKDAKQHRISLHNATGHSAIIRVFKVDDGDHYEGLTAKTPKVVREAIETGKMNQIIGAGTLVVSGGRNWTIPAAKVGDDFHISGKVKVVAPYLKTILDGLYVVKGSSLDAPLLRSVRGVVKIEGKLNAPKLKIKED